MSTDEFISDAIAAGQKNGMNALDAEQRLVWLISEAEVLCDMEGIDAFLDRYSLEWLPDSAAAFDAVGAHEIAMCLHTIQAGSAVNDQLLDRLGNLITSRAGYDYDAICRVVEQRHSARDQ
jgi:hypothetical protein